MENRKNTAEIWTLVSDYIHTHTAGLDYLRESSLIIITANSEFFTRRRTGTGNNQISAAAAAVRPCPKKKQGRENGFKQE